MDEMARKTLNVNLLKADGQEKCQSLHVRNDHLDKLLQEIVSQAASTTGSVADRGEQDFN